MPKKITPSEQPEERKDFTDNHLSRWMADVETMLIAIFASDAKLIKRAQIKIQVRDSLAASQDGPLSNFQRAMEASRDEKPLTQDQKDRALSLVAKWQAKREILANRIGRPIVPGWGDFGTDLYAKHERPENRLGTYWKRVLFAGRQAASLKMIRNCPEAPTRHSVDDKNRVTDADRMADSL